MGKLQFKSGRLPERWLLPVGSMSLNRALGGGLESGRIHVFWGAKASTKSTNALYAIANAQQMGKTCLYVDAEKTFDGRYAEKCGVNIDDLMLLDEGSNMAESLLQTVLPEIDKGNIQVIVIDSLSSVLQESFFEKPEANPMGIYSRSAKFVIAKLLNALNREMQIILISHASMDLSGYKPVLSASMGNAQGHWTSNIIKFQANNGKDNFREDGYRKIMWKIDKSKQPVWPFNGEYYFNGLTADVDRIAELVDVCVEADIVQSGTWMKYGDLKFHGKAKLIEALNDNEDGLVESLYHDLMSFDEANRQATTVDVDAIEEDEDE